MMQGYKNCLNWQCGKAIRRAQAIPLAKKAGGRRKSGWIKTSERLPEYDDECPETVILYYAQHEVVIVGFWDGYMFTDLETGFRYSVDDIPYWMPLPEPPEVEE